VNSANVRLSRCILCRLIGLWLYEVEWVTEALPLSFRFRFFSLQNLTSDMRNYDQRNCYGCLSQWCYFITTVLFCEHSPFLSRSKTQRFSNRGFTHPNSANYQKSKRTRQSSINTSNLCNFEEFTILTLQTTRKRWSKGTSNQWRQWIARSSNTTSIPPPQQTASELWCLSGG